MLYISEFATSVATHLPYLPGGVDPEDMVVRFIVERLIQENPGNAGTDGLMRAVRMLRAECVFTCACASVFNAGPMSRKRRSGKA